MKNLLLVLLIATVCSCTGYHTSSLKHPNICSIAIATVDNDTNRPELRALVQQRLRAAVQSDGAYKLVNSEEADCILYTKITSYRTIGRGASYRADFKDDDNNSNYGSAIYEFQLNLEIYGLFKDGKTLLMDKQKVTGLGRFTENGDTETGRRAAAAIAASDAAKAAVSAITEAW